MVSLSFVALRALSKFTVELKHTFTLTRQFSSTGYYRDMITGQFNTLEWQMAVSLLMPIGQLHRCRVAAGCVCADSSVTRF